MEESKVSDSDERLLHRAVSLVYSTIIKELDMYVALYGPQFAESGEEHRLEWPEIYKDFEGFMENKLMAFCEQEGLEGPEDLADRLSAVASDSERADKMFTMLLRGFSYEKFVSVMKRRAATKASKQKIKYK